MDFPSLQIAALSIVWLLFWLSGTTSSGFFATVLAIVVFCVLIYHCRRIYPYTELHAHEVDSYLPEKDGARPSLKIVSCNVLMTNRDSSKLLHLIKQHQPDIFIALESDLWWEQQFDSLSDYLYVLKCPLDNLYGMHVYSRYPLSDMAINFAIEKGKPSMSAQVQLAPQTFVSLYVVHPAPPAHHENNSATEQSLELLKLAEHIADSTDRIIIAGDLNDVPWSPTTRLFRQISGLRDPRIGRGLFNTFNAFHWIARWPMDHVFLSNHFTIRDIQRLPAMGADHSPLMIELAIKEEKAAEKSIADSPNY